MSYAYGDPADTVDQDISLEAHKSAYRAYLKVNGYIELVSLDDEGGFFECETPLALVFRVSDFKCLVLISTEDTGNYAEDHDISDWMDCQELSEAISGIRAKILRRLGDK